MTTKIFVNMPVKDLPRSRAFFESMGYHFNPQFSNDQAASLVISDTIYAMLLTEPFFKGFTTRSIADTKETVEMLVCLTCESRAQVDDLMAKAVAAGGTVPSPPQVNDFMYGHGFADLDGHHWELVYMDPNAAPPH
ncbi:MAG: VOC family protein [Rhizobacter sp.]